MPAPHLKFTPSHGSAPWRVYFRGKDYWFTTEADARKKIDELAGDRGRLSKREADEYIYCRELLKGVPLLRAVRFFNEHNSARLTNSTRTVEELVTEFKNQLRGRPKYLQEAKRNVGLLSDFCGKMLIGEPSVTTIGAFLAQFKSPWSYDQALKFTKAFFKWTVSPKVRARADNPCAPFSFKKPAGSKIYLSIEDATHVLKVCRREFSQLLPAVALQMFAGIRTEEVIRLEWRSVRRGTIRIEPEVGKMGQVKGKQVPRIIDWWPFALDVCMPATLPTNGKVVRWYDRMKGRLLGRCRETKADFRWGQNAFRHSYGTYGLAFMQSADRISGLMGERDVDTLHNYYAEYETQENGQAFFSIGSKDAEPLPIPKSAMTMLQNVMRELGKHLPVDAAKAKSKPAA